MTSKLLEIGPGRGDFLFYLAEQNPRSTVVGVEFKRKRYDKLVVRKEKRGLENVELLCGDARLIVPNVFGDETFDNIFILFSDPWPKKRHAKNRLFQEEFVGEIHRILKPGGRVYVAHDDPNYIAQIQDVFRAFTTSFVSHDDGVEFMTFYADKWKNEGRTLSSFSYEKINAKDREEISGPCVHSTVLLSGDLSEHPHQPMQGK